MKNIRKKLTSLFTLTLLAASLFVGTLPKSRLEPEPGISACICTAEASNSPSVIEIDDNNLESHN